MLDHRFQKLLWNFASVANVINPFLYAMYDYGPRIGCRYAAITYQPPVTGNNLMREMKFLVCTLLVVQFNNYDSCFSLILAIWRYWPIGPPCCIPSPSYILLLPSFLYFLHFVCPTLDYEANLEHPYCYVMFCFMVQDFIGYKLDCNLSFYYLAQDQLQLKLKPYLHFIAESIESEETKWHYKIKQFQS